MSILQVEQLVKTYGIKSLFDNISFAIAEKQRIGLIGVNGTGKSTLLKVLAGIESSDQGHIAHANDFRIEYLPQNPEFEENLTVLEQIYYGDALIMKSLREYEQTLLELEQEPENERVQKRLFSLQQKMDELDAWDASSTAKTILNKLGITSYNKKVNELSGGQKKRVAIAKALIQPADLLLLDEPTNHLDNATIDWLESYLSQYRGAIMLVTHDRYFLNRVTNRIFELHKGSLYVYEGNYEYFLEKKAEREEQELSSEQKRQNVLRRELAWLRRGAKARTTKQKARIQRVENLQDQKQDTTVASMEISLGAARLGKKVIEVQGLIKSIGNKQLVNDLDYLIVPGERLGIIGPNGAGKSTLLNMLAGKSEPDLGSIEIGETVKIGYYTQDALELNEELRIIEYIKEVAEVVETVDGSMITAEQMLERFMFPRSMQWTYISRLSGGERRRLYLLRVLMSQPNVLFLDEPTNDLDIQTLSILEDYLDSFPGVVLTVSHDRYFLDRVVDHLLVFKGDGLITRFQGNYTEFLEQEKLEKEQAAIDKAVEAKQQAMQVEQPKRKRLSYKEQLEWDTIEDRIAELEEKIENIKQDVIKAGSDSEKVVKLYEEQQRLEQELEQAIERWTELTILVEELQN
ncbi:ABC transporter ATP-binding protein [Bacillus sp. HMF5848]|uniref:ABC-F family ATP-binding cassette domain-containing protein n=1 Tax=Bacillus sp. HMF5848 TaxID=2495421 RepID=UPI000F78E144|nr:ABC-F family ATP-binding cassette domain-containing protein [Bacillus sp. HMF5848]RSK26791.1 ABC transporter ATP-binding protein [Bacillus sp. HMF5848]